MEGGFFLCRWNGEGCLVETIGMLCCLGLMPLVEGYVLV